MPKPRTGELPASLAILGLLIRQSDTAAGVRLRFDEEHRYGHWPRNIVHSSIASLTEAGHICRSSVGSSPSLDLYATTPNGVEHFRKWLHAASPKLPAMRDALRAKMLYIDDEVALRAVLRDILQRENTCKREAEAARVRYASAKRLGQLEPRSARDLGTAVRRVATVEEIRLWYRRAEEWQLLRRELEDPFNVGRSLPTRSRPT